MSESRPFAVVRPLDEHEKWERDAEHDDVFAIDRLPHFSPAAALPAHPAVNIQPPSTDAGCRHDRTEACWAIFGRAKA